MSNTALPTGVVVEALGTIKLEVHSGVRGRDATKGLGTRYAPPSFKGMKKMVRTPLWCTTRARSPKGLGAFVTWE
jgi:hypothetical protein